MGLSALKWKASFDLHLRCENCTRESHQVINVPPGDGAPDTIEDLLDDVLLQNVRYRCRHCESTIGRIFMISDGSSHARV